MRPWPGINPPNCPPECEDNNHPGAQHPTGQVEENIDILGESKIIPWALQPTVGRIVHFQPFHQADPLAAIVTAVFDDGCVNLTLFNADGSTQPKTCARQAQELTEGFWSWPAR